MDQLQLHLNQILIVPIQESIIDLERPQLDSMIKKAVKESLNALDQYTENEGVIETVRMVILSYLDFHWVRHLESMGRLKEGVGLRQYQQEDPMRIYGKEGLELFGMMFDEMRREISMESMQFIKKIEEEEAMKE